MSIVKINRLMISLIATALIIAFVTPQNLTSASEVQQEFIYDENNEKLFLEKTEDNGITTATVTNESNEVVATFSLDKNTNEAYSNDTKLSAEELEQTKMLASATVNEDTISKNNEIQPMAAKALTYSYDGTHTGSLWVVKAGAAAAAAAIAVLVPGMGWSVAWTVASSITSSTGTVYYSTKMYTAFDSNYMYTKRVTTFYKNSGLTNKLYGPVTASQKNSIRY